MPLWWDLSNLINWLRNAFINQLLGPKYLKSAVKNHNYVPDGGYLSSNLFDLIQIEICIWNLSSPRCRYCLKFFQNIQGDLSYRY